MVLTLGFACGCCVAIYFLVYLDDEDILGMGFMNGILCWFVWVFMWL